MIRKYKLMIHIYNLLYFPYNSNYSKNYMCVTRLLLQQSVDKVTILDFYTILFQLILFSFVLQTLLSPKFLLLSFNQHEKIFFFVLIPSVSIHINQGIYLLFRSLLEFMINFWYYSERNILVLKDVLLQSTRAFLVQLE